MNKKIPTGFVATCQCGKKVAAFDYARSPSAFTGKSLGKLLHEGCTIEPMFTSTWSVKIESCICDY